MSSDAARDYDEYITEVATRKDAERRRRARLMTFTERAEGGIGLFALCTAAMRTGIRMDHPDYTEEQVEEALLHRLRAARRREAMR